MWYWWAMLCCGLLVPLTLVFAGLMQWKYCPKEINRLYGYRTRRAMTNTDTWIFAHEHSGKLMFKMGLIMVLPSVLVYIPFCASPEAVVEIVCVVLCCLQLVTLVIPIISTEVALRRVFNKDGSRK